MGEGIKYIARRPWHTSKLEEKYTLRRDWSSSSSSREREESDGTICLFIKLDLFAPCPVQIPRLEQVIVSSARRLCLFFCCSEQNNYDGGDASLHFLYKAIKRM